MHQIHQRISVVPWQIFARFSAYGREIDRPKSDNFLFSISKSLLPPCCNLWSWVGVFFWTFLPPPKEFRNKKLNFSIAARLSSFLEIWRRSVRWSSRYREQNNIKIKINKYVSKTHIHHTREQQLKLCTTPRLLFKGNIFIYSTPGVENDLSTRLQNITSSFCDLEL